MGKFKITESEKNRILRLYKFKILKEQNVPQQAPTNYTLKDIQQMLVDKGYDLGKTGYISGFSQGKGVDGILGNKTLTAIERFTKGDIPTKIGCISGDCQNGTGTYSLESGTYVGGFKNNIYDGQGVYTMKDKSKLEGNYTVGIKQGIFTYTNPNNIKFTVKYENNVMTCPQNNTTESLNKITNQQDADELSKSCSSTVVDGQQPESGTAATQQPESGTASTQQPATGESTTTTTTSNLYGDDVEH